MVYGEPVDNEPDDVTDAEWAASGSGSAAKYGTCRMHYVTGRVGASPPSRTTGPRSLYIRKYGSIYFPYRDCYGHLALNLYKLKLKFSLSYSIQFDIYQYQSEEHAEN